MTPGLDRELAVQRRAERMARPQLEALQLAKLNRLLEHWRGVDWYARRLAEHGAPNRPLTSLQELSLLPVATKEFLSAHLDRIAAMPSALRVERTSGSTGRLFAFHSSRDGRAAQMAATLLACESIGMDYWSDRRFLLHSTPVQPWTDRRRIRRTIKYVLIGTRLAKVDGMDLRTAARVLDQLRFFRPRYVQSYAGTMWMLASAGRRGGVEPFRPAFLLSSGERLLDEHRRVIEDYFDAPVYDRYGTIEVRLVGQQCSERGVLHVPPTRLILENDGRGEILVTDLDNTATPFIRYAIGDEGQVVRSDCPCGRTGQAIRQLTGRTYDVITAPSGTMLTGPFWTNATRRAGGILQYQLIQQSPTRLEMRVLTDERYCEACARSIQGELRALVGDELELTVRPVDRIEPTPAGKHRLVVRLPDADQAAETARPPRRPARQGLSGRRP